MKTTLKLSSYKGKFSSTRKTSPAVKKVKGSSIRNGPLENLSGGGGGGGGGEVPKKYSREGKFNETMQIHAYARQLTIRNIHALA